MMNLEQKDEKIYPAMGNFGKIEIELHEKKYRERARGEEYRD